MGLKFRTIEKDLSLNVARIEEGRDAEGAAGGEPPVENFEIQARNDAVHPNDRSR